MTKTNNTFEIEVREFWGELSLSEKYSFFTWEDGNSEYMNLEHAILDTSEEEVEEFLSDYINGLIESSDTDWLLENLKISTGKGGLVL